MMIVPGTYKNGKEHRSQKEEKRNKERKMGNFSSLSSLVISTAPLAIRKCLSSSIQIPSPIFGLAITERHGSLLASLLSYFLPAKFRLPCLPPPPGRAIYWVSYVPLWTLSPLAIFCSPLFHVMKVLHPLNLPSAWLSSVSSEFRSPRVIFFPLSNFH